MSSKDGLRSRKQGASEKPRKQEEDGVQKKNDLPSRVDDLSWSKIFLLLFVARIVSAIYNYISDCDESMNYWEPAHYILYGYGFQTWEYSPQYAIRSYFYVWLHAAVGAIAKLFFSDKRIVFYAVRIALAIFCALSEFVFLRGIAKAYGSKIATTTFLFLLVSPGLFISSTAFLPSSFSMCCVSLAFGFWFGEKPKWAIFSAGMSVIIGWPFSAAIFATLALDLLRCVNFFTLIKWGVASLICILGPTLFVDYLYFGKLVVAPLNIMIYNVFSSSSGGSVKFGVEPWTFYFVNGSLNFNLIFPLALLSLPIALLNLFRLYVTDQKSKDGWKSTGFIDTFLHLVPLYIWLGIFLGPPHKEERFLFVIYPLICLGGAISFVVLFQIFEDVIGKCTSRKFVNRISKTFAVLLCSSIVVLSVSRTTSILVNYRAPLRLYDYIYDHQSTLSQDLDSTKSLNICVGKEWYRFPSHFFLPDPFRLAFIRSGFKGLLPQPYAEGPNATTIIPPFMNDQNLEEPSRYILESECTYIVDQDLSEQVEPRYNSMPSWKTVVSFPFLDSSRSPRLPRAFWIPFVSHRNHFNPYYLVKPTTQ